MTSHVFEFRLPQKITITKALLRETLAEVRDQLLRHGINGGPRRLSMDTVCEVKSRGCGTAACIGGWTSVFLLGFEGGTDEARRDIVSNLFSYLVGNVDTTGHLHQLFYDYNTVNDYDEPNVAATAIQRYLDGKVPWPHGGIDDLVDMPNVLRYRRGPTKKAKKK